MTKLELIGRMAAAAGISRRRRPIRSITRIPMIVVTMFVIEVMTPTSSSRVTSPTLFWPSRARSNSHSPAAM